MKPTTVSANGAVVIPKEIRERYGLKKGDKVHFIDYGGVLALVPASKAPVAESAGRLKGKTSLVQALMKTRKEEAARGKCPWRLGLFFSLSHLDSQIHGGSYCRANVVVKQ